MARTGGAAASEIVATLDADQPVPNRSVSCPSSLIPGLSDDEALLCLVRVPQSSHLHCRAVSKLWLSVFSSKFFRETRRESGCMDPTLVARMRPESPVTAEEWYALIPRRGLPLYSPSGGQCLGEAAEATARGGEGPAWEHGDRHVKGKDEAGGRQSNSSNTAQEYFPLGLPKPPPPPRPYKARCGQSLVVSKGEMYLLGGWIQEVENEQWGFGFSLDLEAEFSAFQSRTLEEPLVATSEVFRYCPVEKQWLAAAPMLLPRAEFAHWVTANGDIIVAGGALDGQDQRSVEIFKVQEQTWEAGPSLPTEIYPWGDREDSRGQLDTRPYFLCTWDEKLLVSVPPPEYPLLQFELVGDGTAWKCETIPKPGIDCIEPTFACDGHLLSIHQDEEAEDDKQLILEFMPDVEGWRVIGEWHVPEGVTAWSVAVHGNQMFVMGTGGSLDVATLTSAGEGKLQVTWSGAIEHAELRNLENIDCAVALL